MSRRSWPSALDSVLEWSIIGSFTRLGFLLRRRTLDWQPISSNAFAGQHVVITGATSGLGKEAALAFARSGANVTVVARSERKAMALKAEMEIVAPLSSVAIVIADIGELNDVRRAAAAIADGPPIDILVHNAGALSGELTRTSEGFEQTVATQLLGPFLLTTLLLAHMHTPGARIVWMSSGGAYSEGLDVTWLEDPQVNYRGAVAYARVKRAQLSLVDSWAPMLSDQGVAMTTTHPGWADTPGLAASLPTFRTFVRPLLRTPTQGIDTLLWLCERKVSGPGFWFDRLSRPLHRLAKTARSDTPAERGRLLRFISDAVGLPEYFER